MNFSPAEATKVFSQIQFGAIRVTAIDRKGKRVRWVIFLFAYPASLWLTCLPLQQTLPPRLFPVAGPKC
jgi:hypothetical protein